MIEATRPDPTVRPPSRYQNGILPGVNGYFSFILCGKMRILRCICVVSGNFVIMVLARTYLLQTIIPLLLNFLIPSLSCWKTLTSLKLSLPPSLKAFLTIFFVFNGLVVA